MLETSFVGRRYRARPVTPSFICRLLAIGAMAFPLAACHHRVSTSYVLSGSIVGLDSSGLILQNNGGDDLTVAANATSFQFASLIAAGSGYSVTVSSQPAGLTCTVDHGSDTNVTAVVSNLTVSCGPPTYPIAGTITGLGGATGLVLQNNGGDDLSVPANASSFQFTTQVATGDDYSVTVTAQPAGLTCTVSHGASTHISAPVTDISVACNPITHTIAGAISGLSVDGLILQNNGGDDFTANANADTFQFSMPIAAGGGYSITVLSQPTGLTCTVNNGTGIHVNADVTNAQITCSTSTFTVGGSVTGLTGSGLVLQNNGGDNLSIAANAASFEFTTPVAFGAASTVTVQSQPVGQICSVTNGSSIVNSNVTNVAITCVNIITHTLTASAGANGGIAPSGSISVNDGDNQGFTATPDAGWAIDQWLVDGTPVQTGGNVYTLSNITANHTVQVTFGQATLVPSVASLALAVSSASRQITLTNTGSTAAVNVALNYPTWPVGTFVGSTCGSTVAAAASCTITVAPGPAATSDCSTGLAPTSDTITVTADNASATQVDVVVLTYGCIYQAGYLAVIDDTTPVTGSIGGLIAATADISTPLYWGNLFFSAANSTTDGAANTAIIVGDMGNNGGTPYAAKACTDLGDGGYSDWYLPAQDQLHDIYSNMIVVGGGFSASDYYWTSTQSAPVQASVISALYGPGAIGTNNITTILTVRCARTIN